jgi:hypothetical protein
MSSYLTCRFNHAKFLYTDRLKQVNKPTTMECDNGRLTRPSKISYGRLRATECVSEPSYMSCSFEDLMSLSMAVNKLETIKLATEHTTSGLSSNT